MFGDLAVLYLFLGGAGAGCVSVCCALDLALVRQPFGLRAAYGPGPSAEPRERTIDFAFALGFALLAAGVVCLLADLGRVDRVASIFLSPRLSALAVGAWALAVLLVISAALALVRFLYLPEVPQGAVRAGEALALPVALVAMTYTGVLLEGLGGVAFWMTPLLPALFVLSSLSCGTAAVFAAAPFSGPTSNELLRMLKLLVRFDALIIVAEAAVAAAFLLWAGQSAHPGAAASLNAIMEGRAALAWWLGFGVCGIAIPLAVELVFGRRVNRAGHARKALAMAAACALVGALCMRWAVVDSGTHRDLELEEAPVALYDGAVLD